jgi:hypothetical protein
MKLTFVNAVSYVYDTQGLAVLTETTAHAHVILSVIAYFRLCIHARAQFICKNYVPSIFLDSLKKNKKKNRNALHHVNILFQFSRNHDLLVLKTKQGFEQDRKNLFYQNIIKQQFIKNDFVIIFLFHSISF